MVHCAECGTKFNRDLEEECPICLVRNEQVRLASDPETSQDELAKLARSSVPIVVAAVGANPNAPDWVKGSDLDRANNPESPSELLGKLVLSDDHEIAEAALRNPSTPQWAANRVRRERGEIPGNENESVRPKQRGRAGVLLVTTDSLPGHRISEVLGLVYASKSHTKWKGNSQYERLLTAMQGSETELAAKARSLGGNAVVGIRVSANSAAGNSSMLDVGNSDGIILVGTAVRAVAEVKPEGKQRCMSCRELVHHRATKCRYCHEPLEGESTSSDDAGG